jgi:hypothetical protein
MAKVKVLLDPVGNSMNIWWGSPGQAFASEEVNSIYSNDVIVKDKRGVPIGLEIIGVFPAELNIVSKLKRLFRINKDQPFLLAAGRTFKN